MFPVVTVLENASELTEQLGSKYKFWYRDQSFMFKLGRVGTGENWSEKVAAELCELLGLPHAIYELASWKGQAGTVTANVVPAGARLVLGNELLASFKPDYPGTERFRQRQHTVRRVLAALSTKGFQVPLNTRAEVTLTSPVDFFTGYIMLDAWIGNTDRHHENWGLVLLDSGAVHLAPTFDHASSLGRELTDAARLERLNTADNRRSVSTYISKSASALYRTENERRPLSTMDAFLEFAKLRSAGADYWLGRLSRVTDAEINRIIDKVPAEFMSDPARQFARTILQRNRETLIARLKAPAQ
jgi:hypothetical protein